MCVHVFEIVMAIAKRGVLVTIPTLGIYHDIRTLCVALLPNASLLIWYSNN